MTPKALFAFSTEHLAKKDKVRFFYVFKGRDKNRGVLEKINGEHLAPGVVLVNESGALEMESFLNYWKCQFKKKDVLM